MVTGRSPARTRLLKELGSNISRWRTLQGLSATVLAERAHITRDTLRAIETGTGAPRIDSLLAVLLSLGMANTVVASTDPWNSLAGRALMDELIGTPNERRWMTEPPDGPIPIARRDDR